MKFLIISPIIMPTLNFIILNINNIFISSDNYSIMNIFTKKNKIENNTLIMNDFFDIFLQSEYYNEKYKYIHLNCNLYGFNFSMKCFLNKEIKSNITGPYYLNVKQFEKSFQIKLNNQIKHISIVPSIHPLYYKKHLSKKDILNFNKGNYIQINFKIDDNIIPIAMALDDAFIYPTIVAITSIMENSNPNNKYDFYIMHPKEFKQINKLKLKTLEKKYNYTCSINFINMGNQYENLTVKRNEILSTPTYYRLSLSDLLPQIDKIIWLDGDTLTLIDIKEMYEIDMDNYYYKGYRVWSRKSLDKFIDNHICAGVLLINLKELRENNITNKFTEFIKANSSELKYHDETVINYICNEKNGILPPKYGMIIRYKFKEGKYPKEDKFDALRNPGIIHLMDKPWTDPYALKLYGACTWWEYAKKTDYYDEILNAFPIVFEEEESRFTKFIRKLFKIKKYLV